MLSCLTRCIVSIVRRPLSPASTTGVYRRLTMSGAQPVCPKILQSQNDKREYRYIELKNGLRALLISDLDGDDPTQMDEEGSGSEVESDGSQSDDDEEITEQDMEGEDSDDAEDEKSEKKSAAALCIGVGSFSDPDDIPGFAHFLEHMVFMGSEKYPQENNFDEYLGHHGGESNAWTDNERTCFYFEVDRAHFHKALDKFAQFFVGPLLLKDSVDREIEAVDSEYKERIPSDLDRINQIFASQVKEGNPMSKFLLGNTNTLKTTPEAKGIDVYGQLRDFFNNYYTAQYMTLAVHSKHSLDTLQTWVEESFSDIHNNGAPRLTFSSFKDPFHRDKFNRIYKVIPVQKTHKVYLTWGFPPLQEHYKVQPLEYISTLLAHEGEGSILSYLKKRTWAVALEGGNSGDGFDMNTTWSGLDLCITLTDDGLENINEVIRTVFEYIALLKKEGPLEWFYMENKNIEDTRFRFKEKGDPLSYVEKISDNMQLYPIEHFLTGHRLWFTFEHKILSECIDCLRPDNCNIMLTSNNYTEDQCTQKEPWFGASYCVEDINCDWMDSWTNVQNNSSLDLPKPNNFIATDFELKDVPNKDLSFVPQLISSSDQHRLYYKKDTKFNIPKGFVYVSVQSPLVCESLKSSTLLDLFLMILNQNISEPTYPAVLAGYEILCASLASQDGILIEIDGFNHKLQEVLNLVVDLVVNFDCSEEFFVAMKTQMKKSFYNDLIKPYSAAKYLRFSVIYKRYWSLIDKYRIIDEIQLTDLLQFSKQLLHEGFVQSLVIGNITPDEAVTINNEVLKKLCFQKVPLNGLLQNNVLELPRQKTYCQINGYSPDDATSCIINYYLSQPGNLEKSCLNQVLLTRMKEPCFDRLRTKQQLGYSVWCMNHETEGIIGLSINIEYQADKFSMKYVDDQIESFLLEMKDILVNMSQDDFETLIETVITQKKVEDTHLEQEASKYWREIHERTYLFDRYQKEIMVLKTLTKESLVDWFTKEYLGDSQRKLSLQVVGSNGTVFSDPSQPIMYQNDVNQSEKSAISNLDEFRNSLKHLPHIKVIS